MHALVYNGYNSKFQPVVQAFAIRTGYILADMCTGFGRTGFELFLIKNWRTLELRKKLVLLDGGLRDEEKREIADTARQAIQIDKNLKHRSQQQIVAFKKAEQIVNILCEEVIEMITESLSQMSVTELEKLKENQVFGFFDVGNDDVIDTNSGKTCAGDILQLKRDEVFESSSLFFLPAEFYLDEFKPIAAAYETVKNGIETENYYLEHCFSFPNINNLTAQELKAVRHQMINPGGAFRKEMNEWMKMCYSKAALQQREAHFKNKVLPAAALLQEAMDQNAIISHCTNTSNTTTTLPVMIGEIPVNLLWDFYRHFENINDYTYQKLQEENLPGWRSCPVMITGLPVRGEAFNEPPVIEELLSVKKSIVIE